MPIEAMERVQSLRDSASVLTSPQRRRGMLIALLGPDGAGKTSLAESLVADEQVYARHIYMGSNVNASTVGLPTSRWVHQQKKSLSGKNLLWKGIVGILSFSDRIVSYHLRCSAARYYRLRSQVVILDRYIYDSWISPVPETAGKRLRKRIFEGGSPNPDLVVLLDAPGQLLLERKGEHTVAWLESQRMAYLKLQARIPQMVVVDATKPLEAVQREVTSLILNYCNT